MRLRHLIERAGAQSSPRPVATLAMLAILATDRQSSGPTVATVAPLPDPERWPNMLRALSVNGANLWTAADHLTRLVETGAIAEALALGWDARELAGLWRFPPHSLPSRAGLVFSLYPGDTVRSIRTTGCVIGITGGNLRHIWLRASVRDVLLPWQFPTASPLGPEICPSDSIRLRMSPAMPPEAKSSPTGKFEVPEHRGNDHD